MSYNAYEVLKLLYRIPCFPILVPLEMSYNAYEVLKLLCRAALADSLWT